MDPLPSARDIIAGVGEEIEETQFRDILAMLPDAACQAMQWDWPLWARPDQLPPQGDWTTWMVMGGRGAGKTRAGAEWVRGMALGKAPFATKPHGRIALVGETYADAREVMVEGVSGILALSAPGERPTWQPSRRRLEWPNGAVAQLFSATEPESLRGPQFDAAWCDELAKWKDADAAWDMLQFALRLGDRPRQVVTTTPRPTPLVRKLLADPRSAVVKMKTHDNIANLSKAFFESVIDRYEGTRLGRQELDGELLEDREGALWNRDLLDQHRRATTPGLQRIVVAVDPPATSHDKSDACGIVAAGLGEDGFAYVLADATLPQASPQKWAERAVDLYHQLGADKLVAEVNQGGEMVSTIVGQADASVPVRSVRASRGKHIRAEPVALLYEQGRVRHAGSFPDLEDQLCNFVPGGNGRSPDRMDALVWAVSELMLTPGSRQPRVRQLR